ncbi:hypothetical protein MPSEU_001001100 [Mayamaea pseudoterrestris]|nr:hypothetical protein MPSEU_001001100 [Mayamaea pseudoterrestris]
MSKSACLRRIQADIRELSIDPSDQYYAAPIESDMLEWHFTIRGADDTDFAGGWYHGRILLPPDYPMKPPHILFNTPSGRFATNTKICLSFTAFHNELWQPAWGVRLILEALISFLPTPADGAIGALDWSVKERKRLAAKSVDYTCPCCGKISDIVSKIQANAAKASVKAKSSSRFEKEIEALRMLQQQEHKVDKEVERDIQEQLQQQKEPVTSDDVTVAAADDAKPNAVATSGAENTREQANDNEQEERPNAQTLRRRAIAGTRTNQQPGERTPPIRRTGRVPATAPAAAHVQNAATEPFWLSDPILNVVIIVLLGYLFFLLKRVTGLADELYEFDS